MSQDPSADTLKLGDRVVVYIKKKGIHYAATGTIILNQSGAHSPRNPAVRLDQPLPDGLEVPDPDYILPGPENVINPDRLNPSPLVQPNPSYYVPSPSSPDQDPAGGRRRRRSRKVRRRRRYSRRR